MHGYELRKRLNLMLGWGRAALLRLALPGLKKMLRGRPGSRSRPTRDGPSSGAVPDRLPAHRPGQGALRRADVRGGPPSSASATAPASLVQGVEYYKDADPTRHRPRPDARQFGDYHVRDVEFVAAFDVDAKKVGKDLSEAIFASENNTIKIADVPPTRRHRPARPTLDGLGKYYRETIEESDESRSTSSRRSRTPRPTSSSPTCRSAPRRPTSSTRSARSTPASPSSTPCRSSSPPTPSGPRSSRTPASRSSATTSSRQVGATITTACWPSCSRTAASRSTAPTSSTSAATWTSRTCSSASAWSPRRSPRPRPSPPTSTGTSWPRDATSHRPVRLRAVARRPQVGLRPPRGPRVRRRAAEPRVQARGLGLPELGRHHHRRRPLREDRQGPRHRRPDPLGVVVLHEVAAGAERRTAESVHSPEP
jgi:hypothetical protein